MSYLDGDSALLASCQMLMTMVCGYLQMRYTCRLTQKAGRTNMPPGFYRYVGFPPRGWDNPRVLQLGIRADWMGDTRYAQWGGCSGGQKFLSIQGPIIYCFNNLF